MTLTLSTPESRRERRRRAGHARVRLAALASALALAAGAGSFVEPARAQTAGSGEFRTTDYGTNIIDAGAWCWRGYAFQVSIPTTVTHLIGGGTQRADSNNEFRGALFSANLDADGNPLSPKAVLEQVVFLSTTVNQPVAITSLTLDVGEWYYLAQGAVKGGGSSDDNIRHHYVEALDAADLVAGSERIKQWLPSSPNPGEAFIWSCNVSADSLEDATPKETPAKPAVGFRYVSTASLATVTTADVPFGVTLTDNGGAATSVYIQFSTNSSLSGSTMFLVAPLFASLSLDQAPSVTTDTSTGKVTFTFSCERSFELDLPSSDTTYYFRTVALNDAGRSEGDIKSFVLPAAGLDLAGASVGSCPDPVAPDPIAGVVATAVEQSIAGGIAGTSSAVLVRDREVLPLTSSLSSDAGPRGGVVLEAEGLTVTVASAVGARADSGVIVPAGGEVQCVLCGDFVPGSVVEAWVNSDPRLSAAVRIPDDAQDGDCHVLAIPTGSPLDGGGAIEEGAHTLQLRMYTDSGFTVLSTGITFSSSPPVPLRVPTGGGPRPVEELGPLLVTIVRDVDLIPSVVALGVLLLTVGSLRVRGSRRQQHTSTVDEDVPPPLLRASVPLRVSVPSRAPVPSRTPVPSQVSVPSRASVWLLATIGVMFVVARPRRSIFTR